MYGVPPDLNLERFLGATLTRLGLGEFQIDFQFHPEGEITVEGRWELRDQTGRLVDEAQPTRQRDTYRVHRLLGQKVTRTSVNAPSSITLQFESGDRLEVFDDSTQYESFTIQPGDIIV